MGRERDATPGATIWRQRRDEGRARAAIPPRTLDSPVSHLPRIASVDVRRLRKLGLETVRDLLLALPFGWEAYGDQTAVADRVPGDHATVVVTVTKIAPRRTPRRGMQLTEATMVDDDGDALKVVWFNKPWLARQLAEGDRVALAGVVRAARYGPAVEMQNPHPELVEADAPGPRRVGGLMPKYHLTSGLTSQKVAKWVEAALPLSAGLDDEIPEPARQRQRLMPLAEAVRRGHRPESEDDWREAKRRMAFAELLELQAAFLLARRRIAVERAGPIPYRQEVIDAFKAGLGFELTRAQRRATWEIYQDMAQEVPMNRLLNGDVGSGKTAVAAAAAAMAHAAGLQTVVMAPTEILARQHRDRLRAYLEPSVPGLTVELLISDLKEAARRRVRTAAASGHCALLVGTHALLEDDVQLASLGLAVVDEQHRFGTRQREQLRAHSPGGRPHFLAMTATPIPRSLALALYGEMALSVIDELPPGRTPVETRVVPPAGRDEAYEVVRREVRAG